MFRKTIINTVLKTDMVHHFETCAKLKELTARTLPIDRVSQESGNNSPSPWLLQSPYSPIQRKLSDEDLSFVLNDVLLHAGKSYHLYL